MEGFLGTSIQYSEQQILLLEQQHAADLKKTVEELIASGFFDSDYEDSTETESESEFEDAPEPGINDEIDDNSNTEFVETIPLSTDNQLCGNKLFAFIIGLLHIIYNINNETTHFTQNNNNNMYKYNTNASYYSANASYYSNSELNYNYSIYSSPGIGTISCSDIECDITPPPYTYTEFNIENIGPIGAIKVGEEIKFEHNRHRQITEDLNDLLITDSDDDDDELKFCGIHSYYDGIIYDYFNQILCVYNSNELANIDPYLIIRPFYNFSVKQLIKLNRFVQYISHKISENSNNWKYNIKWMTLNENQFHKTYQTKSAYLIDYQEHEVKQMLNDCEIIQLNSNAHYTEVFYCRQKEQTFKLKVIKLPELLSVGIQIGYNKICITERLSMYMNDQFISNIGHGTFVENNDEIMIKVNMNGNIANVKLMFSVYEDNIQIEMKQPFNFGHIFVEQNNGTGLYVNIR